MELANQVVLVGDVLGCNYPEFVSVPREVKALGEWLADQVGVEYSESGIMQQDEPFRCCTIKCIPPSWFAQLQRLYAHLVLDKEWTPVPLRVGQDPEDDDAIGDALETEQGMESHLLCHSSEGYWVPCDWDTGPPLFYGGQQVPGGWVGSSKRLQVELFSMCPTLNISLRPLSGQGSQRALRLGGGFDLSDAALEELQTNVGVLENTVFQKSADGTVVVDTCTQDQADQFRVERYVWYLLYEATRGSIKNKTAVLLR